MKNRNILILSFICFILSSYIESRGSEFNLNYSNNPSSFGLSFSSDANQGPFVPNFQSFRFEKSDSVDGFDWFGDMPLSPHTPLYQQKMRQRSLTPYDNIIPYELIEGAISADPFGDGDRLVESQYQANLELLSGSSFNQKMKADYSLFGSTIFQGGRFRYGLDPSMINRNQDPCRSRFLGFQVLPSNIQGVIDEFDDLTGSSLMPCRPLAKNGRAEKDDWCCGEIAKQSDFFRDLSSIKFHSVLSDHTQNFAKSQLESGLEKLAKVLTQYEEIRDSALNGSEESQQLIDNFNDTENQEPFLCMQNLDYVFQKISQESSLCQSNFFNSQVVPMLQDSDDRCSRGEVCNSRDRRMTEAVAHIGAMIETRTSNLSPGEDDDEFLHAMIELSLGVDFKSVNLSGLRNRGVIPAFQGALHGMGNAFGDNNLEISTYERDHAYEKFLNSMAIYELARTNNRLDRLTESETEAIEDFFRIAGTNPHYAYIISDFRGHENPTIVDKFAFFRNRFYGPRPADVSEEQWRENINSFVRIAPDLVSFFDDIDNDKFEDDNALFEKMDEIYDKVHNSYIKDAMVSSLFLYAQGMRSHCEEAVYSLAVSCAIMSSDDNSIDITPLAGNIVGHALATESFEHHSDIARLLNGFYAHQCSNNSISPSGNVQTDSQERPSISTIHEIASRVTGSSSLLESQAETTRQSMRDSLDENFQESLYKSVGIRAGNPALFENITNRSSDSTLSPVQSIEQESNMVNLSTGLENREQRFVESNSDLNSEVNLERSSANSSLFNVQDYNSTFGSNDEGSSRLSTRHLQVEKNENIIQSREKEINRLKALNSNQIDQSSSREEISRLQYEIERLKAENHILQIQNEIDNEQRQLADLNKLNDQRKDQNSSEVESGRNNGNRGHSFDRSFGQQFANGAIAAQTSQSTSGSASPQQASSSASRTSSPTTSQAASSSSGQPVTSQSTSSGQSSIGFLTSGQAQSRAGSSGGSAQSSTGVIAEMGYVPFQQLTSDILNLDRNSNRENLRSIEDAVSYAESRGHHQFVYDSVLYQLDEGEFYPLAYVDEEMDSVDEIEDLESFLEKMMAQYQDAEQEVKPTDRVPASIDLPKGDGTRHESLIQLLNSGRGE